jgi:hypothetical protein
MEAGTTTWGRSHEPFFHQPQTTSLIEQVAGAGRLVIYVGAGVTITESGHSWSSLVEVLFARLDANPGPRAAIAETFDLPKRASIVNEYFQRTEKAAAPQVVANLLRNALYQNAHWHGGDYTAAIAQLCKEKLALGQRVTIVTTNYDQYLEKAFRDASGDTATAERVRSLVLPLDGAVDGDAMSRLDEAGDSLSVVHLHGVVLEQYTAGVREDVVLDEADYLRTEAASGAVLTDLFSRNDVLILGSSLEDDPLMRALWRTKDSGRSRWAVFPRQNYRDRSGAYGPPVENYTDLIYAQRRRCSLFEVEIVAPDFHSQAAQFVREAAVACECARQGTDDASYLRSRYGARLESWWSAWSGTRSGTSGHPTVSAQRKDHQGLTRALARIQKTASVISPEREKLKLELWVRWRPSSTHRNLRLWASSTGTWVDHQTMRSEEIDVNSEFLAVTAFCNGVAATRPGEAGPRRRWTTYLAVPVRVGLDSRKIQAGVLLMATNIGGEGSIIDEDDDERMNTLIRLLTDTGKAFLDAG